MMVNMFVAILSDGLQAARLETQTKMVRVDLFYCCLRPFASVSELRRLVSELSLPTFLIALQNGKPTRHLLNRGHIAA